MSDVTIHGVESEVEAAGVGLALEERVGVD